MALFLNGIPLFTVELKVSPANYKNAVVQYQDDRDPQEPLLAFKRCLAHFAMDTDLVYMTTRLDRKKTKFLPFNRGYEQGARNPPSKTGFAVRYMWEDVWTKDSVLELVRQFVHVVPETKTDAKGRRTKVAKMIFPRYHQRDAVRRLVADAREKGAGQRYLVQHSAGSGKSNTIAWLAHRLSSLHDGNDEPVFHTVIIITDRRILDRQLQSTVKEFQQRPGVVENIDRHSRQLADAIRDGKKIIVTTLQKFPVIDRDVRAMADRRFAVVIDADAIVHELQAPRTPMLDEIAAEFGSDVIDAGGALDRAALGAIVFRDSGARARLGKIVHPKVGIAMAERMARAQRDGATLIVLDIPLLFEGRKARTGGASALPFDVTVLVYAPESAQIERQISRDGCDREEALRRVRSQLPIEDKKAMADVVIDNSGTPEETERQVRALFARLTGKDAPS